MTKLILDLSDPEVAEAVRDVPVGQSITFSHIAAIITGKTGNQLTADVHEISSPTSMGEPETPAEDKAEAPAKKRTVGDIAEEAERARPGKSKTPADMPGMPEKAMEDNMDMPDMMGARKKRKVPPAVKAVMK